MTGATSTPTPTPPPPPSSRRGLVLAGAAVLVAALVGGRWLAVETAERAWAHSVSGGDVYLATRDLARLVEGLVLLLSVGWGTAHVYYVYRAIGSVQMPRRVGDLEFVEAVPPQVLLGAVLVCGLLYGMGLAWATGALGDDWWRQATLAAAPPRFGIVDPVLQRDLGYYLGELPWALARQRWLLTASATATALVALLYVGIGSLRFPSGRLTASPHARGHLGVVLACLALALLWGAVLDPAEVVAGLNGAADRAALAVRVPGAGFLAVIGGAAAAASLYWAWRGATGILAGGWVTLLSGLLTVYFLLPAVSRSARPDQGESTDGASRARQTLERAAYGVEWLEEHPLPGFADPEAAGAALPLWDPEDVVAVARRAVGQEAPDPGETMVAALATSRISGRAAWLVALSGGRAFAATETDTGLAFLPLATRDTIAWFGPGIRQHAVVAPDTWPGPSAAGIPLSGWPRRAALAWVLQSVDLLRRETAGRSLVWRRDVRDRLDRLAPFAVFEPPIPVLADGALWWIAYGYVASATFPLARPVAWNGARVRYLRAGLLGAVAAATGDTRLYLAPGYDSLSAAWARRLHPLVRPADSLPAALRMQLPYPREAFALAAELVRRHLPDLGSDSATWAPLSREPVELVVPAGGGVDDPDRRWTAQGFVAGTPPAFTALLAGTMAEPSAGPRLVLWRRPEPERLPSPLAGSPQTRPGTLRMWPVAEGRGGGGSGGGSLFTLQGLYADPAGDGAPPALERVYVSWRGRTGEGATVAAALRDLASSRSGAGGLPTDTSLAARWAAAQRLAAAADSALAAGDLVRFGRLYAELRRLLAAVPRRR